MKVTLYGIKNCDAVKKARKWLDARGIAYDFYDYKAASIDHTWLKAWCDELGWEVLLNRVGTRFRRLPTADKQELNTAKAVSLMIAQPSMIKRPIMNLGNRRLVGFKSDLYAEAFP